MSEREKEREREDEISCWRVLSCNDINLKITFFFSGHSLPNFFLFPPPNWGGERVRERKKRGRKKEKERKKECSFLDRECFVLWLG